MRSSSGTAELAPRGWLIESVGMVRNLALVSLLASTALVGCDDDQPAAESTAGTTEVEGGSDDGLELGEPCAADSDCLSLHCRPRFLSASPTCLLAPGYYPHDVDAAEDPRITEGCGEAEFMTWGAVHCSYACTEAEACVGDDVCMVSGSASGFMAARCQSPCEADPECGCGYLCIEGSCSPYPTEDCDPEVLPLPEE